MARRQRRLACLASIWWRGGLLLLYYRFRHLHLLRLQSTRSSRFGVCIVGNGRGVGALCGIFYGSVVVVRGRTICGVWAGTPLRLRLLLLLLVGLVTIRLHRLLRNVHNLRLSSRCFLVLHCRSNERLFFTCLFSCGPRMRDLFLATISLATFQTRRNMSISFCSREREDVRLLLAQIDEILVVALRDSTSEFREGNITSGKREGGRGSACGKGAGRVSAHPLGRTSNALLQAPSQTGEETEKKKKRAGRAQSERERYLR